MAILHCKVGIEALHLGVFTYSLWSFTQQLRVRGGINALTQQFQLYSLTLGAKVCQIRHILV